MDIALQYLIVTALGLTSLGLLLLLADLIGRAWRAWIDLVNGA